MVSENVLLFLHWSPVLGLALGSKHLCIQSDHFKKNQLFVSTLQYQLKEKKSKNVSQTSTIFMYRRPILCTLYGAVDFLNVLKKGCFGGGCYWYIVKYIMYLSVMAGKKYWYVIYFTMYQ